MQMGSYRKQRMNEKFVVRKGSAMDDDRIVSIGNVTMPLTRVKVGVKVILTKKKNRDCQELVYCTVPYSFTLLISHL